MTSLGFALMEIRERLCSGLIGIEILNAFVAMRFANSGQASKDVDQVAMAYEAKARSH